MITAELIKLRHQRTPQVLLLVGVAIAVLGSALTAFQGHPVPLHEYTNRVDFSAFGLSAILMAVLGGWMMGSEYRQDTLKRLAAVGPGRTRIVLAKLAVLVGAVLAMSTVWFAIATAGMALAASKHGVTLPTGHLGGVYLSGVLGGVATALVAYGLSLLVRSDVFAIIGTLGLLLAVDQIVMSVWPHTGRYTLSGALDGVSQGLHLASRGDTTTLGLAASLAVVAAWGLVPALAGSRVFARRDV